MKKRVFQVAREFSISNEALIDYLKGHGHDIRNHMSPISEEMYAQVSARYGEKQPSSSEPATSTDYEFRKRLRDKQAKEQEVSEKRRKELEEKLRVASSLAEEKPNLKKRQEEEKPQPPVEHPPEEKTEPTPQKEKPAVPEKEKPAPKKAKRNVRVVEIPPEEGQKRQKRDQQPKSEGKSEADKEKKTTQPKTDEQKESASKKRRRRGKRKPQEQEKQQQAQPAEGDKQKSNKKRRKKKKKAPKFNEEEIQSNIKQTLAQMDGDSGKSKKRRRKVDEEGAEMPEEAPVIRVSEFMSLSELAKLMNVESTELIKKCMSLGMMVTINQRLDMDTITLVAAEYGYEVEALAEFGEDILEEIEDDDQGGETHPRPPVVTIMGHVDHGKTSLLDHIRESNIIAGESGGITQHIGAYEVEIGNKYITFLDTPGHEAFTAMRARGAQATDLVVLIVAADDNVMPQTIEAISHAKAADVPIVVAINKVDKPSANPDMIRKQLAERDVLVEQWGGKYQSAEISAKTGQNIDQLMELILLEAEILDLKANPDRKAKGVVIESRLDKGKGVVATVLVQAGTLRVGDPFIAGQYAGKVRNMLDERGRRVKEAGPSTPVQVLGFDGVPQAGDTFMVLNTERDTREISQKRQQLQREHEHWRSRPRTLDEISKQIQDGQIRQLGVVLKADVDGSVEAIADSLQKLATDEVAVNVIHKGVGAISESDVLLASASGAIIIGFNVRPSVKARELAAREHVDIRSYKVIYDIISDVKSALEGFLEPTTREEIVGTIEVRQIFKVPKIGLIAGSYVLNGRINRNDRIKLYRDDRLVHDGTLSSLKRFKDDVREVSAGFECGIGIERFNDVKVNDIIEVYEIIEEKRTL